MEWKFLVFDSSGYGAAGGAGAQTVSATEVVITPEENGSRYAAPGQRAVVLSPEQVIGGISAWGSSITVPGVRFEYQEMRATLWESVC